MQEEKRSENKNAQKVQSYGIIATVNGISRFFLKRARCVSHLGLYRKSGYLCGNIIYANYASSCEGA